MEDNSSNNNSNNRDGIGIGIGKELVIGGGSSSSPSPSSTSSGPAQPSRYESQKRRDWNTFGQYLRNQRPSVAVWQCGAGQVVEFMRYLDQFGKTKVHSQGCAFFGQPEPPAPCPCPLRQAWGSLDALVGRLRAAYEEHGGLPEANPFAAPAIRLFLRDVRDSQAKARGIPYTKKKKKKKIKLTTTADDDDTSLEIKRDDHHHQTSNLSMH